MLPAALAQMDARDHEEEFGRYAARLRRRRRKQRAVRLWLPLGALSLFFVVAQVSLYLVVQRSFGLTDITQTYLYETYFWRFSWDTFRSVALESGMSPETMRLFGAVYWIYNVSSLLCIILILFLPLLVRRTAVPVRGPTAFDLFLQLHVFRETLTNFRLSIEKPVERRARRALRRTYLHYAVTPFEGAWLTHPLKQWFEADGVAEDTREVLVALAVFRPGVEACIRERRLLEVVAGALIPVATFAYEACLAEDETYRPERIRATSAEQKARLLTFSQMFEPVVDYYFDVIAPAMDGRDKAKSTRTLSPRPELKLAGYLALTAGGVMMSGVLVLRIPIATGFLAWFAVVFGSLSISLGVKGHQRWRRDYRPELSETEEP